MYLLILFLDDFPILLFHLFNSWLVQRPLEFPRIYNDIHHIINWKELIGFILLIFRSLASSSREHISYKSRSLIEFSNCGNSSKIPMWARLNKGGSSFTTSISIYLRLNYWCLILLQAFGKVSWGDILFIKVTAETNIDIQYISNNC